MLDTYNMSLGSGLSKVAGKVFRIGHLGECNELTLLGALTGVEMGLSVAGVPHRAGGVGGGHEVARGANPVQRVGASQGDIELIWRSSMHPEQPFDVGGSRVGPPAVAG